MFLARNITRPTRYSFAVPITHHKYCCRLNGEGEKLLPPGSRTPCSLRLPGSSDIRSELYSGQSERQTGRGREKRRNYVLSPEIEKAMVGVKFIADHLKDEDADEQV